MFKLFRITIVLIASIAMSLYFFTTQATETVPGTFTTSGELTTPEITVLGLYNQSNSLITTSSNVTPNTKHSIRFELTNTSYAFDDMVITVAFFATEDGSREDFDQVRNVERTNIDGKAFVVRLGYQGGERIPLEILYNNSYGPEDISWDDNFFDNDINDAYAFEPADNSFEFAIHFNMSKVVDVSSSYYIGVLASQGIDGQDERIATYASEGPYYPETYVEFSLEESSLNWTLEEQDLLSQISMGGYFSTAMTTTGKVFTWGDNSERQLGNGFANIITPTEMTSGFSLTNGEIISSIDAGYEHTMVLTSSGRVFSWGDNFRRQLGDGTASDRHIPVDITNEFNLIGDEIIVDVSAGRFHSAAVSSNGRVFTWGLNGNGQLGNGNTFDMSRPEDITDQFSLSSGETIVDVDLGGYHSSAVSSNGQLFVWGYNIHGQLGDGTTTSRSAPVNITSRFNLSNDETIAEINLGLIHSSVLTSTGRVFTWGHNDFGELGDGTTTDRSAPVNITSRFNLSNDETIIDIDIADGFSSAVTSTGRLFTWGYNFYGQLGIGSTSSRSVPTDITSRLSLNEDEKVMVSSLGSSHSSALTSDYRILTWGYNGSGQLGDGSRADRFNPTDITENFDLSSVTGTFLDFDGVSEASIDEIVGTNFTFISNASFSVEIYAETTWIAEDPDNEGDFLEAYMVDTPDSQQEFRLQVNDTNDSLSSITLSGIETTVSSYSQTDENGINGNTLYLYLTLNTENFQDGTYSGDLYVSVVVDES